MPPHQSQHADNASFIGLLWYDRGVGKVLLAGDTGEGWDRGCASDLGCGMRELLTAREVARLLKVHEKTVYEWSLDGSLPAIRFGQGRRQVVRFDPAAIEALTRTPSADALFDMRSDANGHQTTREE